MDKRTRPDRKTMERLARVYGSDADAGRAIGVGGHTIRRWCAQYGIESPTQRRRRKKEA